MLCASAYNSLLFFRVLQKFCDSVGTTFVVHRDNYTIQTFLQLRRSGGIAGDHHRLAKHLGFTLALAGPEHALPKADTLAALNYEGIICTTNAEEAVRDAMVINTDTWISMGQEAEKGTKEKAFFPYQVNAELLRLAASGHSVFHCLPAYRGYEITDDVLESHAPVIFTEAENRLHAQKAVLYTLATSH